MPSFDSVKKIYLWNHEITKAYLWDNQVWGYVPTPTPFTPWTNTIYYFPFENDINDHSGNNYAIDVFWTQESIGRRFAQTVHTTSYAPKGNFCSYRIKVYSNWSWWSQAINVVGIPMVWSMRYELHSWSGSTVDSILYTYNSSYGGYTYAIGSAIGQWRHLAYWRSATEWAVCWVNWVKYNMGTASPRDSSNTDNWFIFTQTTNPCDVAMSDVILESVLWTDQQVQTYFNATKSKYWLS